MKKQIFFGLLFVFVAFANPLMAQQQDSNSLQQKVDSLKAIIKDKDDKIQNLEKKLENGIGRKIERSHSMKTNIENLEKGCKAYSDTIAILTESIDTLRPQYENLKAKNLELENHKKHIAPLVERQLMQMATTIDQTWLGKTYAEINETELQEELKLYENFVDQNAGVGKAYKELKAFNNNVLLYKRGVEIVNSPYSADQVESIMQSFEALAKNETHKDRKTEVGFVLDQLKNYGGAVSYFQNIIIEVDKRLESYKPGTGDGTYKKAWKQIKSFLDTEYGNQVEQRLAGIPWLDEQYRLYIKQLETDPYGANSAHDAIIKLVP